MGNIDDFLISLGFDTTKLKGQLDKLHNDLEKAAGVSAKKHTKVKVDEAVKEAKAVKKVQGEVTRAQRIATDKLITRVEKLGIVTNQYRARLASIKKPASLQKLKDDLNEQIALQEKLAVKAKNNLKPEPQLHNAQVVAFQKQQAKLERERVAAEKRANKSAEAELRASLKRRERIQKEWDSRRYKRAVRAQMQENFSKLAQDVGVRARNRGVDPELNAQFIRRIRTADNVTQAKQYADALRQVSTRIQAVDQQSRMKLMGILKEGDLPRLVLFNRELGKTSAEMNKARRSAIGLNAAQNGLHDSTRNLIRQYASLYAIFAGTAAISHQAKAMDGANAGLVAVTGNAEEAAQSLQFITQVAEQNGLAIADAAKDYVKFKAAIGDNHTIKETEEMFKDLTKAGVVFQLSQDDMKGIIRATQQMFSKQKITAKFFGRLTRNS